MWRGIMGLGTGLALLNRGEKSPAQLPVTYSHHLVTIQHDDDGRQPGLVTESVTIYHCF